MREDLLDRGPLNLNVESRGGPGLPPYVTLSDPESKDDPVKNLVADGLLMTDRKAGGTRRNMAKIFETYTEVGSELVGTLLSQGQGTIVVILVGYGEGQEEPSQHVGVRRHHG